MNSEIQPPFDAYLGSEPFLFVSYSHIDKKLVYPIIGDLFEKKVRIWYDQGIPASSNWIDEIADTIIKCNCFIVFITSSALKSENVLDEIYSAKKHKKKMVVIYLEDTELPPGIDLQIGRKQALFKHKMPEETFWKKLMAQLSDVSEVSLSSIDVSKVSLSSIDDDNEDPTRLKIFLCFSPVDKEFADSFIKRYRILGMDMSIDLSLLSAGDRWRTRLNKMIEDSDIFLLFWSKSASQSKMIESEWKYALTFQEQKGGHFIRPFYWEDPIPRIPEELQYLHFQFFKI